MGSCNGRWSAGQGWHCSCSGLQATLQLGRHGTVKARDSLQRQYACSLHVLRRMPQPPWQAWQMHCQCLPSLTWMPCQQDVNPFSSADSSRQAPAATPSGLPPPYESILEAGPGSDSIGTGSYPSSSAPWAEGGSTAGVSGRPKEFEIAVADPVKQGDGVSAYVSYKVRDQDAKGLYPAGQCCIWHSAS